MAGDRDIITGREKLYKANDPEFAREEAEKRGDTTTLRSLGRAGYPTSRKRRRGRMKVRR